MKQKRNKGFTLIELLVTIAVIAVLVLLAAPRLLGYTDKAKVSELTTNTRAIQDASERYYFAHDETEWPRLTDTPYTDDEVKAFSEKIYDITGEVVDLDEDGNYYDIDFDELKPYIDVPGEKANYILQNPVGKVYSLYKPTPEAMERLPESTVGTEQVSNGYTQEQIDDLVDQGYKTVSTAEDLNNVRNNLSGKYIQTKDIDMSSFQTFKPIGDNFYNRGTYRRFKGTYDGGNYKITGLTITERGKNYVGLFGITNMSNIKNVGLIDIKVTGGNYVGGLVGYNYYGSTIKNSYVVGSVNGGSEVGGLVGYNYYASTISNSYATGSVNGRGNIGGLVGYNDSSSNIKNSYATASVTGSGFYIGGLVGDNYKSTITNSYYDKELSGAGGPNGIGLTTNQMKLKESYNEWNFDTIWTIERDNYPTLIDNPEN